MKYVDAIQQRIFHSRRACHRIWILFHLMWFGTPSRFLLIYAESVRQASIAERTQQLMADINQRYRNLVILAGVGILLIAIFIVIGQFL